MILEFTVYGKPQQVGSKAAFVPLDKRGNPYRRKGRKGVAVQVTDTNKKGKPWMAAVAAAAAEAMGDAEPFDGPVVLSADFFFLRPKSHFGTGRNSGKVKPSAPRLLTQLKDLSKLVRAVEDGMTGIVYHDDVLIWTYEDIGKYWTTGKERAVIRVDFEGPTKAIEDIRRYIESTGAEADAQD